MTRAGAVMFALRSIAVELQRSKVSEFQRSGGHQYRLFLADFRAEKVFIELF